MPWEPLSLSLCIKLLKTIVSEIWTLQVSTVINLWLFFSQKYYTADKITDIWVFSLHSCCGKISTTPKHPKFLLEGFINIISIWHSISIIHFLIMLNATHLFYLSIIIFNTNPKNTDHIFTSWHEFKNSITTEIGLLHLQTIHSHIHFLIIVKCNVHNVM